MRSCAILRTLYTEFLMYKEKISRKLKPFFVAWTNKEVRDDLLLISTQSLSSNYYLSHTDLKVSLLNIYLKIIKLKHEMG